MDGLLLKSGGEDGAEMVSLPPPHPSLQRRGKEDGCPMGNVGQDVKNWIVAEIPPGSRAQRSTLVTVTHAKSERCGLTPQNYFP